MECMYLVVNNAWSYAMHLPNIDQKGRTIGLGLRRAYTEEFMRDRYIKGMY